MKKNITRIIIWIVLFALVQGNVYAADSPDDLLAEGMRLYAEGDYERAFARFQIAGEVKGNASAWNMLGICYRDGLGTDQDYEEAEHYFKLAADQGDRTAADNLHSIEAKKEEEYQNAIGLYLEGRYAEAAAVFKTLNGYGRSKDFLERIALAETPVPAVQNTPAPVYTPQPVQEQTMGPFSPGRFFFVNGASLLIPYGFTDMNTSGNYQASSAVGGYSYVFYHTAYEMYIELSEAKLSAFIATGQYGRTGAEVLNTYYNELIALKGPPAHKYLKTDRFRITGYTGSSIYYTYVVLAGDTIYVIDYLYPTNNRDYCDRIVETTEASFSKVN